MPPKNLLPRRSKASASNPGKQAVGTVYHYKKSNIDGSNPSHVDLYIASEGHIESFKYHPGYSQGTLVAADMDWKTFSVKRFETNKINADGPREARRDPRNRGVRAVHQVRPNARFRARGYSSPR